MLGFKSLTVVCAFALAGGVPVASSNAQVELEDKTVTNVFLSTDIRDALADVSNQVGVPILAGNDVEGAVTLTLDEKPLPEALDMMLAPGGYVWRQMPNYVLVGSSDPESPLFSVLSETRRVELSNITAERAVGMIAQPLQRYVTADTELNRVLITAPAIVARRLASDLREIDAPAKHVLLEARVVVLERDALLNLGVEWDFPTVQTGTLNLDALNQSFPWAVSVGLAPGAVFTDALMLSLNLLQQNEEATIVSNPQLTVRDGGEAEMGVVTEEFFQIETQESIDLEVVDSGTRLSILPQIGEDNKITLTLSIEVSDVVGRSDNGNSAENLPIVTRRTAQSTIQVASGGTAAISGLMESRTDILQRQVPGAAKIPALGRGFNNDQSLRESKQLAVFVTATIVEDPPDRLPRDKPYAAVDEAEFREEIRQVLLASQPR